MRRRSLLLATAPAVATALLALTIGGCEPTNAGTPAVNAVYSKTTGKLELLTYDTNKDSKTDTWSHIDSTHLVRIEIDRNFDGVVDR